MDKFDPLPQSKTQWAAFVVYVMIEAILGKTDLGSLLGAVIALIDKIRGKKNVGSKTG